MANNRLSGNLLGLKIKDEYVTCEVSCDFNFETDLRGASPVDSGRWKEWIPGVRSWSLTLNAAMLIKMVGSSVHTVINAFLTGERMYVEFRIKDNDIPNLVLSGNASVQNGGISSSVNTLSSWNTTLQGNGPFTADINSNIVYAISTLSDESQVLEDGLGDLLVSTTDTPQDSAYRTDNYGIFTTMDTGQSVILIPHLLSKIPLFFTVQALSDQAIDIAWSDLSVDSAYIRITPNYTDNNAQELRYSWEAKL